MYEDSFSHLNDGGKLYIVTLKNTAGKYLVKLKTLSGIAKRFTKKGYYVFRCNRRPSNRLGLR